MNTLWFTIILCSSEQSSINAAKKVLVYKAYHNPVFNHFICQSTEIAVFGKCMQCCNECVNCCLTQS